MLLISANTAPTPIPINFSGIKKSQTSGHSTSASKAIGQYITNRISQPTSDSIAFTGSSPRRNDAYRLQSPSPNRSLNFFVPSGSAFDVIGVPFGYSSAMRSSQ